MTRPNNVTTNYTYDNLSRLLSVLHQAGASTIDGAVYTVDAAGNRTSKADQLAGVTSNYGYDAIYELLSATQGGTATESYSYDPVGNRLSSLGVSPYSYNPSNEMVSTPTALYVYDANGNTTTKTDSTGTTTYSWDFENRLTSVTLPGSGGTVTFKYDPFGRRIYKSSSAGTSIYAYDGDNLIEEMNASSAVVARYSQGQNIDEPLAMSRASVTSYYEADGLGSITSLSNTAGALAQTYTFDSFGNQTASSGSLINPFQYTARESDPETGLYYYRARYYDPTGGRFPSEDPVRSPLQANWYKYVRNNPVKRIDTSGMQDNSTDRFHSYHGCKLVATLRLLLWTSNGAPTPTSGWYFLNSYQEGPGDFDPVATLTCLWGRDYEAEVWGHYLVVSRYRCWRNDCVLGFHTWEQDDLSWEINDLGKHPVSGPTTTTQMPIFGVEDETGDILCKTTPKLRPQGP